MQLRLDANELIELIGSFDHLTNYSSNDPTDPINPLTYISADGDSCLHIAAYIGDYRAVQLLLKAGLDINEQGDLGYTPLHYASSGGHKEVIDLLLKNGARTDIKNEFGKYALK